jgi:Icc-related predicted phosphoesterase
MALHIDPSRRDAMLDLALRSRSAMRYGIIPARLPRLGDVPKPITGEDVGHRPPAVPDMVENRSLTIAVVSDTHEHEYQIEVPPVDVLVHCGDATGDGRTYPGGSLHALRLVAGWMQRRDARHRLFVPGNHDLCFDLNHTSAARRNEAIEILASHGITYLADRGVTIDGVKFWGSPWVPNLPRWAFHDHGADMFQTIPTDTEVLITHGPAWGILDSVPVSRDARDGREHFGSNHLLRRIAALPRLKVHLFGHIHESRGIEIHDGTIHVNASSIDGNYCHVRDGAMVVDLGTMTAREHMPERIYS